MFSIRECHHLLDRTQELAAVGFLPSQINCCTSDAAELHHLPPFYCCSTCTIPPAWTDRLRAQRGLRQSVQGSGVWGFGQSSSEKSREGLSDGKSGCCRAFAECGYCSVPGSLGTHRERLCRPHMEGLTPQRAQDCGCWTCFRAGRRHLRCGRALLALAGAPLAAETGGACLWSPWEGMHNSIYTCTPGPKGWDSPKVCLGQGPLFGFLAHKWCCVCEGHSCKSGMDHPHQAAEGGKIWMT